jgi:hypothetical protein
MPQIGVCINGVLLQMYYFLHTVISIVHSFLHLTRYVSIKPRPDLIPGAHYNTVNYYINIIIVIFIPGKDIVIHSSLLM